MDNSAPFSYHNNLLEVSGIYVHCKSGVISETVQERDVLLQTQPGSDMMDWPM